MGMFHEGSGMTVVERLTHKRANGIKEGHWSPNKKQELVDALAAYEDTGLTPEQIRQIDRLYEEKCREVDELQQRDTPVKVKPIEIYHPVGYRVGQCSKCENIVRDYMKFCFECGCRLEWGSWEEWEETCKH